MSADSLFASSLVDLAAAFWAMPLDRGSAACVLVTSVTLDACADQPLTGTRRAREGHFRGSRPTRS